MFDLRVSLSFTHTNEQLLKAQFQVLFQKRVQGFHQGFQTRENR